MKNLSKTNLLFIISFVATLVATGAYTFFFLAMKSKTEATVELSAKVNELSGEETRMGAAVSALRAESLHIEKLSSYFIKESDIVAFTKKIEELGVASGTMLSLEALEPEAGAGGTSVLNVRIKTTGKFQDIMHFFVLLENYPAKFEWRSVNLVRDETSSPLSPRWRTEVSLVAFNFVKE